MIGMRRRDSVGVFGRPLSRRAFTPIPTLPPSRGKGLICALLLLATPALAQEPAAPPDRPLADAGQEARAQRIFEVVRCVVCQHESVADSPAGIAGDMRRLIREEIADGATDQARGEDSDSSGSHEREGRRVGRIFSSRSICSGVPIEIRIQVGRR